MIFNENKIPNESNYYKIKNKKLNFKYLNKDNTNINTNNNVDEIIKLKKIIAEKDSIILELHSKLKEFRKDIDLLKNKMIYISDTTQSKDLFNDNNLQIQIVQRFQLFPVNNYKNNTIESINNLNKYFNDLEFNLKYERNSNSFLNLLPYKNYNYNRSANNFYKNGGGNSNKNDLNDIKFNSSLFFQRCKILMNNEEYLELLRIIKLFNGKRISKAQTYEIITNYLEKINPDLLKEFNNLFVK